MYAHILFTSREDRAIAVALAPIIYALTALGAIIEVRAVTIVIARIDTVVV